MIYFLDCSLRRSVELGYTSCFSHIKYTYCKYVIFQLLFFIPTQDYFYCGGVVWLIL